jgi:cobalt-zinc-cadmium efflux system membrane fusion protein
VKTIVLIAWTGAALLLAGCGGGTETRSPEKPAPQPSETDLLVIPEGSPKLARLRVEAVGQAEFESEVVTAPGKVEANSNRISRVGMPVAGRVRQVLVKLGDAVEEGQPLVLIDSPDAGAAQTAYRQTLAQIRQAQSTLAKAEKDLARVKDLYEHRAAAMKEVLAGENDLTQAQADLEQIQAARDDALHRLTLLGLKPGAAADVAVRAPLAGKILEISVVPGEYRNDTNAPLMTIADLSTVWIGADVPESMIRLVEKGEAITVELSAYPGEVFRGRVTRISDVVDPVTRSVKVQAELANPAGRLRPEMYGQVRHNHGMVRLPAIPASAVMQKEGRDIVLIEKGKGRFRERVVKTGPRRGELAGILSGLAVGERAVVDGVMLLKKN